MLQLSSLHCNNFEMRSSTSSGQCFLRQWYQSDEDTLGDTLTSPSNFTSWSVINEPANWTTLNWNLWIYPKVGSRTANPRVSSFAFQNCLHSEMKMQRLHFKTVGVLLVWIRWKSLSPVLIGTLNNFDYPVMKFQNNFNICFSLWSFIR